jgi:hypothetical protein
MNITINEKLLEQYNLSVEEFLILYICSKNYNIKELLDTIIAKGYANKDVFNEYKAVVSDNIKNLIVDIIINSDKKIIDKEKDFLALANKMRDLYPSGKKPGTNYSWKDSGIVIAQKLKTLVVKFGCSFTEKEALDATKKYIESFNGNYTYMQLLKYFILKNDKNTGDIKSEFMTLIENKEDIDVVQSFDEMRV